VGLAAGATGGVLALGAKGDCDPYPNCGATSGGRDANDRAHTWAMVSTVSFGVGIAGLALGVALVLTAPHGGSGPTALRPDGAVVRW
jgi:hypothetical protein